MDLYPHELGTCITISMCMHQSHHPCCYTKSCLLDSEIFKSPKQSLGDLLCLETYCVCSDSSSFFNPELVHHVSQRWPNEILQNSSLFFWGGEVKKVWCLT